MFLIIFLHPFFIIELTGSFNGFWVLVFNYWEPTHYLSHGFGLQTWEYSPEYAIRSWFYVGIHAVLSQATRVLPFATKVRQRNSRSRFF